MNVFMELIDSGTNRKVSINLGNVISYETFLSSLDWTMVRFPGDQHGIYKIDYDSFGRALDGLGIQRSAILDLSSGEWDNQGLGESFS